MSTTQPQTSRTDGPATCEQGWTPANVTRSLLGWGAVAGPFYVLVSLAQALTRAGFDLTRHEWSLLENGDLGWIQVANLVLTGVMILAFAVGLSRALAGEPGGRGRRGRGRRGRGRRGRGGRTAAALTAVFGAGLVAAGVLRADPALGFPVGTPEGVGTVTADGIGHFAAAGIGFVAVAASCFVLGRRFAADGDPALARFSGVTGVVFLAGFLAVASGAGSVAANILFTFAVVLVFSWIAVVAVHLYRSLAG